MFLFLAYCSISNLKQHLTRPLFKAHNLCIIWNGPIFLLILVWKHPQELAACLLRERRVFFVIYVFCLFFASLRCTARDLLNSLSFLPLFSLLCSYFLYCGWKSSHHRWLHISAMDVWMLGCISFVFGTMVELAFVCYISRCQNSVRRREKCSFSFGPFQFFLNSSMTVAAS